MGGVIGTFIGGAIGKKVDDNAEEDCFREYPNDSDCEDQFRFLVFGGLGGLLGAVIGGIVGANL